MRLKAASRMRSAGCTMWRTFLQSQRRECVGGYCTVVSWQKSMLYARCKGFRASALHLCAPWCPYANADGLFINRFKCCASVHCMLCTCGCRWIAELDTCPRNMQKGIGRGICIANSSVKLSHVSCWCGLLSQSHPCTYL
jgi:hypothetical protein